MMVMLDTTNTQSEDDISGRARPAPGRYHAAVQHVEEKGSRKKATPGLEVEFQIVADGIDPKGQQTSGQAGRTIPLFLSYLGSNDEKTKTCIDRVCRLALCCGVIQPGEFREPDWNEAIGRELVIEIEGTQYDDEKSGTVKSGSQVSFLGFWSLGNKNVANVPRDNTSPGMQQLAKAGSVGPVSHPSAAPKSNGGAAAPKTKAAGTVAATAGAASPARKPYSDL